MSMPKRKSKSRDLFTLHRYVGDPRFKDYVDIIAHPLRAGFDDYVARTHGGVISPALQQQWDQSVLYYADLVLNIESDERARCIEEIVAAYPEDSSFEAAIATDIGNLLMAKLRSDLRMYRRDRAKEGSL